SGGNLETFKIRLLELIALLSRSASDTDSPVPEIDKITKNSFDVILGETDFELICFLTGQAVEEFTGIIGHKGPKILSDNLLKAVNHIALHYSEDLSLKDIADIVFVSAYYLSHLFRKELNTTFSDYLCKIRVEKAKDMLKKGEDLRINEIAEQTGFHNPNYFTTLFKKATGMPPREYRNFFR
ncbi:MAG: AraC family transcriptional regulator, partial [Treponema sp.]|nr:AraC family transcriptional regulator [Treponema sp.]